MCHGVASYGRDAFAWFGLTWHGMVWYVMSWCGAVWLTLHGVYDRVWVAWHGVVLSQWGLVCHDAVWMT